MQLPNLLKRVYKGSGDRPTRMHDEEGNIITPVGYIYALHSIITTFLHHYWGYRPQMPWISYRAQRYLARLLRSDWTVLEFGSGMSTIWFAQRCRKVYSFEHNPLWYDIVKAQLSNKHIINVSYTLRDSESYPSLSEFPENLFDFIMIDGIRRTDCVRNAISKIKPSGWIYLDNTDMKAKSKPGNDLQQAEQLLLSYLPADHRSVKYFTDFVPTNFVAKQGMLVNLNRNIIGLQS